MATSYQIRRGCTRMSTPSGRRGSRRGKTGEDSHKWDFETADGLKAIITRIAKLNNGSYYGSRSTTMFHHLGSAIFLLYS
jgi:hypothetical protein